MLQYLVFRLLSLLASLLPPTVAYRLCILVGDVAYWLLPRRRGIVRRNLSIVLGCQGPELDRRVREVFREGAKYYYDTFRVPALTDEELARSISVVGWEHLDSALERGRGAVMFTAHLGSPALVAQVLTLRRHKVTTVVEPLRPRKLLDLMIGIRGRRGIRMIPIGPSITRELTETLRRNEIVAMVVDRDLRGTGVPVRLFGVLTTLPAGPVMLALRTGAALIPAFTYRRQDGRFDGEIWEPLALERTGDLREDLRRNTQKVAGALESAIRRSPGQWVVFEPIWPGEAGLSRGAAN